ncbi:MAG TPA: hypothetical protein VIG45_00710, partial [Erysipelothrix sp.]
SLITNGVYLLEHQPNLSMFDMLGVSIDSLDQVTNRRIGRRNRQNEVLYQYSSVIIDVGAEQDFNEIEFKMMNVQQPLINRFKIDKP